MKDGTVLYKNRLLLGSDLQSEFMNASKSYLTWMVTQQCMIELEDPNVEMLAMLQLTFFTCK